MADGNTVPTYYHKLEFIAERQLKTRFEWQRSEGCEGICLILFLDSFSSSCYAVDVLPDGQFVNVQRGAVTWWDQDGEAAASIVSRMKWEINQAYRKAFRRTFWEWFTGKPKPTHHWKELCCGNQN